MSPMIELERPAVEPAKLRVYIGAAPGVGKTYRMLEQAHQLKKQGVDVVIGLVEPHGRAETAALIQDLEIIPEKEIAYRSVTLKEMDLDAILVRRPDTCVVDELAHTNVPGSRNRKRYEDVLELLDAGINIMTAVNIQHLETLNDAVSRSASTQIRETIPDSFLKRADEVVNVDVTVDELRTRLREGKIYASEKVEQALANFFPQRQSEHASRTRSANHGRTGRERRSRISPHAGTGAGAHAGKGHGGLFFASRHRAIVACRCADRRKTGDKLVCGLCRNARQ